MNKFVRSGTAVALFLILMGTVWGQSPSPLSASQGTLANQLPLYGTASQPGSAAATQAPTPGANTSVNTINPTASIPEVAVNSL
jgi:hypothetical protein